MALMDLGYECFSDTVRTLIMNLYGLAKASLLEHKDREYYSRFDLYGENLNVMGNRLVVLG